MLSIRVNGEERQVPTPERNLLSYLRFDLGLTGTKYGCGEGLCGACTILLDGQP
ncbi:MAG: 2Fe-2S iron-sulfur cluster binding domain-containing protein, partial [Chloroflexi bacterium]|nr:2Fe-2S iron-sulfur cluster binding domain-containing protein [Chloroflexota bacterium]